MNGSRKFAAPLLQILLIGSLSFIFLVPFNNPYKDIDLQVSFVIACGITALLALVYAVNLRQWTFRINTNLILFALFYLTCDITLLHTHSRLDVFGFAGVRLGFLELMSCVTIGWALSYICAKRYLRAFYTSTVTLALFSIIYSALLDHTVFRLGGPIFQADILAAYLGAGFIVGIYLRSRESYKFLLCGQLILGGTILLTETRTVIYSLLLLGICTAYFTAKRRCSLNIKPVVLVVVSLVFMSALLFTKTRLTNVHYGVVSIEYRAELARTALADIHKEPFFGYGQGSLYSVLSCHRMFEPMLLATCSQGYGFTSTHNVFLDKTLELGIFTGLLYFLIYIRALLHASSREPWLYMLILIGLYYLTNVTDVPLELLYWCIVMRVLRKEERL